MENVACLNVSTWLRRRRAKRRGGKHIKHIKNVEGKGRTQSRQVNKINIAV